MVQRKRLLYAKKRREIERKGRPNKLARPNKENQTSQSSGQPASFPEETGLIPIKFRLGLLL